MLDNRQLQECIDDIRDGSEEAVKKLVNEYYTFYLDAASAARLSREDAKHFANHATRSLFANIRSISDAESWQALADRELKGLANYTAAEPEPQKTIIFETPRAAEKPRNAKDLHAHLFEEEEEVHRPEPKVKRRPEPIVDDIEETEEIEPPKKKKSTISSLFAEDGEGETEDIVQPIRRQPKKQRTYEEPEVTPAEKPKSAKERLAHLFDDEDEEEEVRTPAKKPKRRPEPEYEDDETEEIRPPKKKNKLMSAIFVTDDETEEIKRPAKNREKAQRDYEEDEDDYDDDEDSGFHLPVWLLALLAVILLIGFAVLAVKVFLPDTWDSITGGFGGGKEKPAETAAPTPTIEPTATPEITISPEESAAPAEETAEPEPETPANSVIGTASVKVDKLNIRTKPSTSGDRAGTAVNGKSYDVYEVSSGEGYTWYRIADNQWIADKGGQWITYKEN